MYTKEFWASFKCSPQVKKKREMSSRSNVYIFLAFQHKSCPVQESKKQMTSEEPKRQAVQIHKTVLGIN